PGWAEQDPRAWINALHSTLRRVLDEVTEGASAVKAISFGSQLDGMVVCDAQGKPLRNAMIWMDRRAEAQAAAMAQRVTREDFYHQVGTNLDSSHAVFKALWVKDEEPDVFASAARLMPPGSFVVQEAAGVSMVDYSNASSLALLDPRTRRWSDAVLDAAGLKARMLPELAPGTLGVGTVTEAFAAATGLARDTAVVVGCGDEMAATLGAGVFSPGEVCDVVGTAEPVCGVVGAAGGQHDAGRMSSSRRPRQLAARKSRLRLGRQLALVARSFLRPRLRVRRDMPPGRRSGAWGGRTCLTALHAVRDGAGVGRS